MLDLKVVDEKVVSLLEIASNRLVVSGQKSQVQIKAGAASQSIFVTKDDIDTDKFLRSELTKTFPEVGFVTEEHASLTKSEYNWVIDPIDGTGNYSHGMPFYGISVALWQGNMPIYGAVTLPALGTQIRAIKNEGVWLNKERLQAKTEVPEHPYVVLAPVGKAAEVAVVHRIIGEVVGHPRDFGCCVFQAMEVFVGRLDVFVGYQLSLWDIGAMVLIAENLGLPVWWVSEAPDIANYHDGQQFSLVFGRSQKLEKLARRLQEK